MAQRAQPITRSLFGLVAAALVAAITLGTLAAVWLRADEGARLYAGDWSAIRFTLMQAALSALISAGLAIPVARALARRRFRGRGLLVTLLGAPFILPVIVAILGLIEIFGRNGLISSLLGLFGIGPLRIYGLQGVLLAHVFFNLPLATRLILQGWQAIPAERFRLAATLDLDRRDVFTQIERPMLAQVLPGVIAVIFVICTTSFAVALTLGGGPRATTVELAIYQAFRFDFDLAKAALLAVIQAGICLGAAGIALIWPLPRIGAGGLDRAVIRWDNGGRGLAIWDGAWISAAALFLLLPLGAIVLKGITGLAQMPASVWQAAGISLAMAVSSSLLVLLLALPMAQAALRLRWIDGLGYLAVSASPLVIGTGLFILLRPYVSPRDMALPVTAVINAMMALPFVMRALVPALRDIDTRFGPLADSLALSGWARLRWLTLPRLRRPLGFALGLTAALSMGDLGVIALFSPQGRETLPLLLYQLMGAYRMEAAAGAALLLLALSLGLFWLFDRGGRVNADT